MENACPEERRAYQITDTALAAYLVTEHYPLLYIDFSTDRYKFYFTDSDSLRTTAETYLADNALVNPARYARALRKLNRLCKKKVQWEED